MPLQLRSAGSETLWNVAGPTRLELATSGVTGRRSNQLNYDPAWLEAPNDNASNQGAQGVLPAKEVCPAARLRFESSSHGDDKRQP